MHETCCPQYTIRLDVTRFKPTKGQRHVLNRLRRYLDGDSSGTSGRSGVATPPKSGPTNRIAPTSGANGGSASTAKRDPSREGGANAPRGGKGGSSNGDAGGGGSEGLGRLSERVAAAAVAAVEAGFISGLRVEREWLAEVVGWSQVRAGIMHVAYEHNGWYHIRRNASIHLQSREVTQATGVYG